MNELGSVLMIWAHPDDETYLAGALSAALCDAGHRVVCVTATRGDAGGDGDIRSRELDQALSVLGVTEHHWLDYPDGACASIDADVAAARLAEIINDVRPDTVLTFGPDGMTGHPDHRAVGAWTSLALARAMTQPRLLHAVARDIVVDRELDEDFGVYELGRPRVVPDDQLELLLELEGPALDRKIAALLRQESQTGRLVAAVGLERFRAWVAYEAFAVPLQTR